jgi:hypothetical protein
VKGTNPDTYNHEGNLALLCRPCHRTAHRRTDDEIVDRLVAAERASGLSHRDFAKSIGLSESYWCHIRRRRRISLTALSTIVRSRPDLALPVMHELAEAV